MKRNHLTNLWSLATLLTLLGVSLTGVAQTARTGPKTTTNIGNLAVETISDQGLYSATDAAKLDQAAPFQHLDSEGFIQDTAQTESNSPLLITTSPLSSRESVNIEEDMVIMDRLLEDSLGHATTTAWASDIPLLNYVKNPKVEISTFTAQAPCSSFRLISR